MQAKHRAYAFFFNANHPELGVFYGPPCTSKIVSSAQHRDLGIKSQVLRGDLLPHLMAYKISSVSTEVSPVKNSRFISQSMSADMGLYKLILCDFAESLSDDWHTVNTIEFPFELARKSIWTIVLPSITQEAAEAIDNQTKSFSPYLGATRIDTGNPIHIKLFSLIDGAYIEDGNLYCRSDYDREVGKSIADSYGANSKPILVDPEVFHANSPPSLKMSQPSKRGLLSASRLEGKSKLDHRQQLAVAILDYLQKNPDVEGVEFYAGENAEKLDFQCDENKVRNYLLNPEHPDGAPKAKFFTESLGITRNDWKYLSDQISGAMSKALIFRVKNSNFGINYGALIEIRGRNDRTAIIQTGWMVKSGEPPRLVTAYPHSEPVDADLEAPLQNIAPPELIGDAKWADIYRRAHEAGEKAAHLCTPIPMTLSDSPPIFAGMCGFAWVIVSDTRHGMAKWLKDNGIGRKNYKSGWAVPARPTPSKDDDWDIQSIEPKKAYAEAFGKVLLDNGIECKVDSRLD
ncbi:DUF6883 domain-containing protein [Chitinimonas sp. BJYL2]|uniref:DUF6883 domain-containing protein n=1 Tax=Chitinimonas sp. BJYL2 TaxID=2976696 RepID=UPI0022B54FBA|nr:DUF6883 domain-containing protein [Chitinimonas sp. BJYL2]